jgi:hypothetical protein
MSKYKEVWVLNQQMRPAGYSEIDKYAIQIYKNTLTTKTMETSQKSTKKLTRL